MALGLIFVQFEGSSFSNYHLFNKNEINTPPFGNHLTLDLSKEKTTLMTMTGARNSPPYNLRNSIQIYDSITSLTGDFSDFGLDSDGDGLFNYLCIGVGVNITQERELFYLEMELGSVIGNFLFIKRIHNTSLNLGFNTLYVPFKVSEPSEFDASVSLFQLNTSYKINYVEFGYVGNSGATYYPINQLYGSPYTTRVYNNTEFDFSELSTTTSPITTTTQTTTSSITITEPIITEHPSTIIPVLTPGFNLLPFLMGVLVIITTLRYVKN